MIDLELSGVIWGGVVEQSGAIGSNRELAEGDAKRQRIRQRWGKTGGPDGIGGFVDCADWSGLVGFGPVWSGLLSEFCFLLR